MLHLTLPVFASTRLSTISSPKIESDSPPNVLSLNHTGLSTLELEAVVASEGGRQTCMRKSLIFVVAVLTTYSATRGECAQEGVDEIAVPGCSLREAREDGVCDVMLCGNVLGLLRNEPGVLPTKAMGAGANGRRMDLAESVLGPAWAGCAGTWAGEAC